MGAGKVGADVHALGMLKLSLSDFSRYVFMFNCWMPVLHGGRLYTWPRAIFQGSARGDVREMNCLLEAAASVWLGVRRFGLLPVTALAIGKLI